MEGLWLLSAACIIFTVCMFSSGLSDLRLMVSKQSVDNIQFLPFLTTDLNNLGWLYYGYLKEDWTLMTVNSIGASLQTLYMAAFIYYSPEKRRPLTHVFLAFAVLVLGFIYFSLWLPDVNDRLNQLGLFCSIFTISMYLSPLADLPKAVWLITLGFTEIDQSYKADISAAEAQIIRTKSTKCLSFPLTVTTFLTSTSWVLYGMQLNDAYIMVPNFPGIVTSLVRIWLFWQYPQEQPILYRHLPS